MTGLDAHTMENRIHLFTPSGRSVGVVGWGTEENRVPPNGVAVGGNRFPRS